MLTQPRFLWLTALLLAVVSNTHPQSGAGQAAPGPQRQTSQTAAPQPQQGEPPAEVKPEDRCTIEGLVVNAATGEPLKKARLVLRSVGAPQANPPREAYAALSDASGRFAIREIAPGRYYLRARRNGFAQQDYGQKGPDSRGTVLALERGQVLRDLTIRLQPGGVITGRVVDEDGEPLSDVGVMAMRYAYLQGKKELVPFSGGNETNDLGEYRLFGLLPGRYYVVARDTSGRFMNWEGPVRPSRDPSQQEQGYARTYYPGVSDIGQAEAILLRPGEERRGIDFRLTPVRLVTVRGKVVDEVTGNPVRNVSLMLMLRGGMGFEPQASGRVSAADGSFELRGVAPGSYVIIGGFSDDGRRLRVHQPVEVGTSDLENVLVTLGPGVELKGAIKFDEQPAQPVEMKQIRVYLQPAEGAFPGGGRSTTKEDGTFTVEGLSPGPHHVRLWGLPEGVYLKRAQFGDDDALEKGVTIQPGAPPAALELTLSADAGVVEGIILDEDKNPVTGAQALLVPDPKFRHNPEMFVQATADQNGRFVAPAVRPGEYRAFAFEELQPGAYIDPDFLRPFEDSGKTVRVEPRQRQSLELELTPLAGSE